MWLNIVNLSVTLALWPVPTQLLLLPDVSSGYIIRICPVRTMSFHNRQCHVIVRDLELQGLKAGCLVIGLQSMAEQTLTVALRFVNSSLNDEGSACTCLVLAWLGFDNQLPKI